MAKIWEFPILWLVLAVCLAQAMPLARTSVDACDNSPLEESEDEEGVDVAGADAIVNRRAEFETAFAWIGVAPRAKRLGRCGQISRSSAQPLNNGLGAPLRL